MAIDDLLAAIGCQQIVVVFVNCTLQLYFHLVLLIFYVLLVLLLKLLRQKGIMGILILGFSHIESQQNVINAEGTIFLFQVL